MADVLDVLQHFCVYSEFCFLLPCVYTVLFSAVFLWARWKRHKGLGGGVHRAAADHDDLEDIRENILNYNEEGGGEQDQVRIAVLRYY